MSKTKLRIVELFYPLAFLIYLYGSSLAHIEHGIELSLWLMTIAIVLNLAVTTFPWFGIHWLRLEPKGCIWGWRLSLILQIASLASFSYAMLHRLWRSLPQFHTYITLTTLLWAAYLLLFIYSRHACQPKKQQDDSEA